MEFIEQKYSRATVEFSKHELAILNNALNEVCHRLKGTEFETRIGGTEVEIRKLLVEFGETYGAVPDP
jgi:hypothetical protein